MAIEHNAMKIALITGGSRGLGKNAALAIADQGIDVIVTYRTGHDEAQQVVDAIQKKGRKAAALALEAGDVKTFPTFFAELSRLLKSEFQADKFDILVNNAGQSASAPFATYAEEAFDALMNTHFKGVFFLTQKALPLMNDGGRIITLSSGLTRFTSPTTAAYASMKGAIEVLTKYLAKDLGPRGITVNCVAPGAIETDFGGGYLRANEDIRRYVIGATALGRTGLPDDIGPVIAFLCTEGARWISGQRIEVSGGMNL